MGNNFKLSLNTSLQWMKCSNVSLFECRYKRLCVSERSAAGGQSCNNSQWCFTAIWIIFCFEMSFLMCICGCCMSSSHFFAFYTVAVVSATATDDVVAVVFSLPLSYYQFLQLFVSFGTMCIKFSPMSTLLMYYRLFLTEQTHAHIQTYWQGVTV